MAEHICNWCKNVFSEEELTPVAPVYNKKSGIDYNVWVWACDKCAHKHKEIGEVLTKNALRAFGAL